MNGPQLGVDFFPRGQPEVFRIQIDTYYELSLFALLKEYGNLEQRKVRAQALKIEPFEIFTVEQAIGRLSRLLGLTLGWKSLWHFLPKGLKGKLLRRSAIASTLAASFELAKEGQTFLKQSKTYGPIHVRRGQKRIDAPEEED